VSGIFGVEVQLVPHRAQLPGRGGAGAGDHVHDERPRGSAVADAQLRSQCRVRMTEEDLPVGGCQICHRRAAGADDEILDQVSSFQSAVAAPKLIA
jgi:hypothetical protein